MAEQWSEAGDPPTAFERALIEQVATAQPRDSTEQMLTLVARIGLDALCALLDEFGGEKVHIPKRSSFFAELYRPIRDRAVREALRAGQTVTAVAEAFGMSPPNVIKIANKASRDA